MNKPAWSRTHGVLVLLGAVALTGATTALAIQRVPPPGPAAPLARPAATVARPSPEPAPAPRQFPAPFDARLVRPFDAIDMTQLDANRVELVASGRAPYEDRDRQHWGAQPRFEAALYAWYSDPRPHDLTHLAAFADRGGLRCDIGFVMRVLRVRAAVALIAVRLEQLSRGGDRAAHRWLTEAGFAFLRDIRRGMLFGPSEFNAPLCIPLELMLLRQLRQHAGERIGGAADVAGYLDILRRDDAEEQRVPTVLPPVTAPADPDRTLRRVCAERLARNRWMRDGTVALLRVMRFERLRGRLPDSLGQVDDPDLAMVPRQPNGERYEYRRTPAGFEMPPAQGWPAGTESIWPVR